MLETYYVGRLHSIFHAAFLYWSPQMKGNRKVPLWFWGNNSDEKLENSNSNSKKNIHTLLQILEENKDIYGKIFIPSKSHWAIGLVSVTVK